MNPPTINDPFWPRASAWLGGAHAADALRKIAILGAPVARGSITPGHCDLAPKAVRDALRRFSTYDIQSGYDLDRIVALDHGDLAVANLSRPRRSKRSKTAHSTPWSARMRCS